MPNDPPALPVHPSNAEALQVWDGPDGDFWAGHEARFDEAVAAYHRRFLDAAAIAPGEQVLDIGCGNGQTTRDVARLAAPGGALGVDLSSRMIEQARRRATRQGIGNARFEQADAQIHPFAAGAFDVAVSRIGVMFFGDPVAAFGNIGRALRPGGRLALLVWQAREHNPWMTELSQAVALGRALPTESPEAPGPFSLADPDRVRRILATAGFTEIILDGERQPVYFGSGPDDAFRFVRGRRFVKDLLEGLDEQDRTRALAELRANLVAHHTERGVRYPSAAWVVLARRR